VSLRVELCPYGEPALDQLRQLIDDVKGDDPLRPVTVVVPRGTVSLGVRRVLASGVSPIGRVGVANVSFVTLPGLAGSLAEGDLARSGRFPLTDAMLRAALRDALSSEGGPLLGSARDHPSTVDALVATYHELRPVADVAVDRLASSSARAAEVVAVLRGARERTSGWFDDVDLLGAAAAQVEGSGATLGGRVGTVVLYLPTALTPPAVRLVSALAAHVPCVAVLGMTGDADADALAHEMIDSLRPELVEGWSGDLRIPFGDAVLSAPAADAELLLVLRDLMERFAAGTPLEQMAIAHSGSAHYVTLLHTMLREAGIPFNGGGLRPISSTVAGRVLLGALHLPDRNWRREDVAEWLHTGPIVHRGRTVPSTRWDVLSVESGIGEGLDEWHRQLESRSAALRAEASRGEGDGEDDWAPRRQALEAEADRCTELLSFVDQVVAWLGECPADWESWARWAKSLLHRLVGGSSAIDEWPSTDRAAAEAVEETVDRLAHLGQLGSAFSPATAKAALTAELAAPAPQTSRFGTGVWVAPLGAVVGIGVDVLYVVGMNDRAFPGRVADDVLLPDRERGKAQGDAYVPMRGGRALATRRDYLAALAGARVRLLSFPRGDQRDGRALRPSRWALDTIGALAGSSEHLYSSDLEALPPVDGFRIEPSYLSSVRAPGEPASLEDRDTRSLLDWTLSGGLLIEHYLCHSDPLLGRGVELSAGRAGGFTRFNGKIGLLHTVGSLAPPVLAATRLEVFARCPRRYLFQSVLQVMPRPVSERLLATDRMAYGSLVHGILEAYVRPLIGLHPGEGPDELFSADRLLAIAHEKLDAFEADGLAGPGPVWRAERIRLLRELRRFAHGDLEWRRREGVVTTGVEQSFGDEGHDPVTVGLPGRQPVHFRGTIDRTDVNGQGERIVTDYKTGSAFRFQRIEEDHFLEGSAVQLPVYALAAGASETHPVRSEYWCVSEGGGFRRYGFVVTPEEVATLGEVVGVLIETLESGHFPAIPGAAGRRRADQCKVCPYNSVCPSDRHQSWDLVKRDPALSDLTALVEPA
jgi:ATP-dependent helicase/nuclease subunit B